MICRSSWVNKRSFSLVVSNAVRIVICYMPQEKLGVKVISESDFVDYLASQDIEVP